MLSPLFDIAGAGIGFRAPHETDLFASRPAIGFVEVHAENYMAGGAGLATLRRLRRQWPVGLHGVGLSLGSAEGLDSRHLDRLAALVRDVEPVFVSEHLSWSIADGRYLNDLLPLPYTDESLGCVAANVERVQARLGRRLLIENPSAYLRFRHSPIPEPDFLAELVVRTGCGLLFDVNNVYVGCRNLGGDPERWLQTLPEDAVAELHLAGHSVADADGVPILVDDHGSRVCADVWHLYERAVCRFPAAVTLVEWDSDLPPLAVLLDEAAEADRRRRRALAETCRADAA